MLGKEVAELGEEGNELWLEVLIIERGEELNTVLSAQEWEAGSLGAGLKITDVGSSICSSSVKFDDSEEVSTLVPATSALCMAGGGTTINMTSGMSCTVPYVMHHSSKCSFPSNSPHLNVFIFLCRICCFSFISAICLF